MESIRSMGRVLALVMVLGGGQASLFGALAEEIRIDFDRAAEHEAVPTTFSSGLTGQGRPPVWRILKDRQGEHEFNIVAETSGDASEDRFPLLIYRAAEIADGELTISFKPVAGKVDRAAGIAFRLSDERNYYVARANALENNVRLYRVVNGQRHQFAGRDVAVATGRWQDLTIRATGNRFDVLLNGAPLFQATDTTFAGGGRVALWTKSDSLTHFRKLTIRTDR